MHISSNFIDFFTFATTRCDRHSFGCFSKTFCSFVKRTALPFFINLLWLNKVFKVLALLSSSLFLLCKCGAEKSNLNQMIICICRLRVTVQGKDQTVNPLVSGPSGCTCLVRWLKKIKQTYYLLHSCANTILWKLPVEKGPERNVQERFISGNFSISFEVLCL